MQQPSSLASSAHSSSQRPSADTDLTARRQYLSPSDINDQNTRGLGEVSFGNHRISGLPKKRQATTTRSNPTTPEVGHSSSSNLWGSQQPISSADHAFSTTSKSSSSNLMADSTGNWRSGGSGAGSVSSGPTAGSRGSRGGSSGSSRGRGGRGGRGGASSKYVPMVAQDLAGVLLNITSHTFPFTDDRSTPRQQQLQQLPICLFSRPQATLWTICAMSCTQS